MYWKTNGNNSIKQEILLSGHGKDHEHCNVTTISF
jgi:hypothetical protein